MFEGKLTSVLNKLLGEYVHGISAKDLSVAVFKGDVVLKNLRLKTEALNALDLPFVVRSGLVGKLSLQIPWRARIRAIWSRPRRSPSCEAPPWPSPIAPSVPPR